MYELVYGFYDEENVSIVMNNYIYDKMVNFIKKIFLLIKVMWIEYFNVVNFLVWKIDENWKDINNFG